MRSKFDVNFNKGLTAVTGACDFWMNQTLAGFAAQYFPLSDVCVQQERPAAGGAGEAAPGEDGEESERSLLFDGGPVCPARSRAPANEDQVRR